VVCDRILNADSAFQIFQFIFQTADQALQVRHASPASDEPEIEIVGVVRQGDVDCLPVQRDPRGQLPSSRAPFASFAPDDSEMSAED